ncbi:hypothetical protein B296_00044201 [Ensete ventricosum]|uniref:Uncharacterized protein n=1 Tax=Ensete ventricosum TaxID=4639 RepID=A0A426WWE8_ENSVE|nr:hypothetical protein B296_00044201 [Ensete ventricosum]
MHQVDAVGNSPGVGRKLAEGIGSSPGWRKRVRQKKIETHRKIVGGSRKACRKLGWSYNELRSSLGIGPSSDDEMVSHWEFAKRFAEGIGKLTGNTKGDRREEDRRIGRKNVRGYRIMREIWVAANTFGE